MENTNDEITESIDQYELDEATVEVPIKHKKMGHQYPREKPHEPQHHRKLSNSSSKGSKIPAHGHRLFDQE
jgi:hypothetical protein